MISLQVNQQTFNEAIAGEYDVNAVLKAFSNRFKDDVDFIVVMLDTGLSGPGSSPFYGRYFSVDTRLTGRTRRLLGAIDFPFALGALTEGPFLHEFLHEWANSGVLPNELDPGHWGYAGTGGQLGGWDPQSLTKPLPDRTEVYQAGVRSCQPLEGAPQAVINQCNQWRPWGTIGNGGNRVPFSPLELWVMGLIPDSELSPQRVASIAMPLDPMLGRFIVIEWKEFTAAQIRTNLGIRAPNTRNTQRHFRAATLVLTLNSELSQATQDRIRNDIEVMQFRGPHPSLRSCSGTCLNTHNLYTATGGRMQIGFAGLASMVR